jgi:transcriptional regulator with XRE-family HTH domain
MAKTKKLKELLAKTNPEVIERARLRAKRALVALHAVRRAREMTQETLADALGITQPEVSKLERRADLYVSTLRRYIEAMGGQLEIIARFPDGETELIDLTPNVEPSETAKAS